jgi:hypothetical protein
MGARIDVACERLAGAIDLVIEDNQGGKSGPPTGRA